MSDRKPNRVFIGIPEDLAKYIFWVDREYRTNPLSHSLGGTDIVVEFNNGKLFGYDLIKYPNKYLEGILTKELNQINGQKSPIELEDLKSLVKRIYAGVNSEENSELIFQEIWSRDKSKDLPFKLLGNFTSEGLKQYLDVFKQNLDLALIYISVNFPFSYSYLLENWEDLESGCATYSGFMSDIDRAIFSQFGLVYNRRIRWNSKLRSRFDFGFENPWQGYIDGTPGDPVEYDERDFLDVFIPLDINIEIKKRNRAWIDEFGTLVARDAISNHEEVDWDRMKQLDESLVSDKIPFLSPKELESLIKTEPEKFLFNESLWENTLKHVIDEDFCSLILDEKRRNSRN
ncbi:MAG: hypothetical protein ACJLTB_15510 [Algoriphagus aquaeductus]|uniref:hypothetical protein n=1 Tax=Algoriphagus aquaeductus TaxID=475299 RepID=UPI00387A8198